ncbi:MAG TPA: hypothetical protein VF035_03030 [Longimicrobiales bacterium]
MAEQKKPGAAREYDTDEGLSLALSYLEDPANVPCPRCGPDTMEVVCYLDAHSMEQGDVIPAAPDDDYTVVLYCHECGRAAALDLSRDAEDTGDDTAADENREAA